MTWHPPLESPGAETAPAARESEGKATAIAVYQQVQPLVPPREVQRAGAPQHAPPLLVAKPLLRPPTPPRSTPHIGPY